MGIYLNPGNAGFARIIKKDYIDKTGMISVINAVIDTTECLTCISRPRRFGKSYAAKMLCAYYDCTCDSHDLFEKYEISKIEKYEDHINKYNVIYLDIAAFLSKMHSENIPVNTISATIKAALRAELVAAYPELEPIQDATDCMVKCIENKKPKFIFIIDEWDAVIREARNDKPTQESYLNLLREWFKNGNFTDTAVAAAYMTGILPIKKDGTESAISDFDEYSVLEPGEFASYFGFTESEVKAICSRYNMSFEEAKTWYDGYSFGEEKSVYNPYSVMKAMDRKKYRSYWRKTSAAEALITYVNLGGDDLQEKLAGLIAGEEAEVYTDDFENDVETFKSDDDILTLLIHLGYLAYDEDTGLARVPNEELREEFRRLLKKVHKERLAELVKNSEQLLSDTLSENEKGVAEAIQKVRDSNYAPTFYNNEQALRYAVKFAYIVCADRYMKIEELPTGKGIADIVYIPNRNVRLPALLIELKWNEAENTAIEQIKNQHYPAVLENYFGEIVLVGITYTVKDKNHTCKIEKITK